MRIRGVIFDLDATLVNLGGFVDWRKANNSVIEEYVSCGCPKNIIQKISEKGLFNMLNIVREENRKKIGETEAERIQDRVYSIIESCEREGVRSCHPLPGCASTLCWLEDEGIKMGIATSNSQCVAEEILKAHGLRHFFSSIVGRRPGLRMKPNPDPILKCLEEMGVKPEESIVVGDSVKDIRAANAAGVLSIAVPSFFTKRQDLIDANADLIIDQLQELPMAIISLEGSR